MKFDHFEKNNVCIVAIYGNFAGEIVNEFNQYLKPLMRKIESEKKVGLIIDMQDVDFIDSSGIGLLCSKLVQLKKQKKRLVLSNVTPAIQDILMRCGLYSTFTIYSNTPTALSLMGNRDAPKPPPDTKNQKKSKIAPTSNDFMRPPQK